MFPSRTRAAASVLAGEVMLLPERRRAEKPGQLVPEDVELEVAQRARSSSPAAGSSSPTRSTRSGLEVAGRRALDVGASTGGFTDCLLQRGAEHVIALDVAYGQLDWRLRSDPRVTVIERRNARALTARASCPTRPDLIVIDVSFISVAKVLRARCSAAPPSGSTAWRWSSRSSRSDAGAVGKGGVVRDPALRRGALVGRRRGGRGLGAARARLRQLRAARAQGQPGDASPGWPRPGARRACRTSRPAAREVEP